MAKEYTLKAISSLFEEKLSERSCLVKDVKAAESVLRNNNHYEIRLFQSKQRIWEHRYGASYFIHDSVQPQIEETLRFLNINSEEISTIQLYDMRIFIFRLISRANFKFL